MIGIPAEGARRLIPCFLSTWASAHRKYTVGLFNSPSRDRFLAASGRQRTRDPTLHLCLIPTIAKVQVWPIVLVRLIIERHCVLAVLGI